MWCLFVSFTSRGFTYLQNCISPEPCISRAVYLQSRVSSEPCICRAAVLVFFRSQEFRCTSFGISVVASSCVSHRAGSCRAGPAALQGQRGGAHLFPRGVPCRRVAARVPPVHYSSGPESSDPECRGSVALRYCNTADLKNCGVAVPQCGSSVAPSIQLFAPCRLLAASAACSTVFDVVLVDEGVAGNAQVVGDGCNGPFTGCVHPPWRGLRPLALKS